MSTFMMSFLFEVAMANGELHTTEEKLLLEAKQFSGSMMRFTNRSTAALSNGSRRRSANRNITKRSGSPRMQLRPRSRRRTGIRWPSIIRTKSRARGSLRSL